MHEIANEEDEQKKRHRFEHYAVDEEGGFHYDAVVHLTELIDR